MVITDEVGDEVVVMKKLTMKNLLVWESVLGVVLWKEDSPEKGFQ